MPVMRLASSARSARLVEQMLRSQISLPAPKKKKQDKTLLQNKCVMGAALFWVPCSETPTGGTVHCFSILKRLRKQEGGEHILNHGASGLKTVLAQTYRHCLSANRGWVEYDSDAINIFMRCRFYSTRVKFCSANRDYNSEVILYTREIKHTICENPCCPSTASWRTKHKRFSSHTLQLLTSAACEHALQGEI